MLLLAALALGALAIGTRVIVRRKASKRQTDEQLGIVDHETERGIAQLRCNDIVFDGLSTWVVQGVMRCCDGEQVWREAHIDDSNGPKWMVVDEGESERVLLGLRIAPPPIAKHPSQQIEHAARVYRLERWGRATCHTLSGERSGTQRQQDYWDYCGPGHYRLWLRRTDDNHYLCYTGELRSRGEFELLPHA